MLRKIRIALAAIFFIGITLLLIGIGEEWWGWMAKLQFLPACLALNAAVITGIIILTLISGRLYCSVICPLGVFQDLIYRLRKTVNKKRHQHFRKESKILRYVIWLAFVACLIAGVQVVIALLAPYSAYGRMVASIVHPHGWVVPAIAAATLILLVVLVWTGGRTWCNSICPVGTTLSFFSRFALLRPSIDKDACKKCGKCERECRASCIDVASGNIDYSRCVDCFDCIDSCAFGSLKYRLAYRKPSGGETHPHQTDADSGRRAFLSAAVLVGAAATLKAQENKVDGGLAAIEGKKRPQRTGRIVPFGAQGEKNFYSHCTACQLCVQNCPNGVLYPSTDLEHLMQPEISYENGWCRPECTSCSQVCPTGAILPLSPEEKTTVHIGTASVDLDLCLANRGEAACGNCARHCPAEAIKMVHKVPGDRNSARIPTVDESKCIGCGACEYLCPSRPFSAIHINGLKEHRNG
ncbi:MAG: 4Fe-4S dicluster domain-containing protein [Bacteroidales bacterium]|nr:4Fe-4S dicluster domain-containing protein [Bacteroidales bacterium]